ncbi:hypothetical protein P879_01052, partial [Paragonimus westermani]
EDAVSVFTELVEKLQTEVQFIEHCFRSGGSLCRVDDIPISADSTEMLWLSAVTVQCDSDMGLFPVPDSNRCSDKQPAFNVQRHSLCFPTFQLIKAPDLNPIPVPDCSNETRSLPFRWVISLALKPIQTPTAMDSKWELSLEPRFSKSTDFSVSWVTPSVVLPRTSDPEKSQSVRLVAYTSHNLLQSCDDSDRHLYVNLNVMSSESGETRRFAFTQPICLSFSVLLNRVCAQVRLTVERVLPIMDVRWTHPHERQWYVSSSAQTAGQLGSIAIMQSVQSLLESRLHLSFNQCDGCLWPFWITCGPFTGLSFSLDPVYDDRDPKNTNRRAQLTLKARSNSPSLLSLFNRVTQDYHDPVRFDSIESPNEPRPSLKVEHSDEIVDCLLDEVRCLADYLKQLIERTMRERIPQLSDFLARSSAIGEVAGQLELAHRLAEWRSLVTKAHLTPVTQISAPNTYAQLYRATNLAFSRLSL